MSKLCKCVGKLINFTTQSLGELAPGKANTPIAVNTLKKGFLTNLEYIFKSLGAIG